MKKIIFIVFVLLSMHETILAQGTSKGKLTIIQHPLVDTLLNVSKRNQAYQLISGYRIQIFMETGNDAVIRANEAIDRFKQSYPNLTTYLTFGQPYYRVRVGDFRTRLEAEGQLRFIVKSFNQAFITKDFVFPPTFSP